MGSLGFGWRVQVFRLPGILGFWVPRVSGVVKFPSVWGFRVSEFPGAGKAQVSGFGVQGWGCLPGGTA